MMWNTKYGHGSMMGDWNGMNGSPLLSGPMLIEEEKAVEIAQDFLDGLNQKTQSVAIQVLQKVKKIKADIGKGRAGIAAAALYIASIMDGKKVTQKSLAKATDVTEVTVRNRYKGLNKSRNLVRYLQPYEESLLRPRYQSLDTYFSKIVLARFRLSASSSITRIMSQVITQPPRTSVFQSLVEMSLDRLAL